MEGYSIIRKLLTDGSFIDVEVLDTDILDTDGEPFLSQALIDECIVATQNEDFVNNQPTSIDVAAGDVFGPENTFSGVNGTNLI